MAEHLHKMLAWCRLEVCLNGKRVSGDAEQRLGAADWMNQPSLMRYLLADPEEPDLLAPLPGSVHSRRYRYVDRETGTVRVHDRPPDTYPAAPCALVEVVGMGRADWTTDGHDPSPCFGRWSGPNGLQELRLGIEVRRCRALFQKFPTGFSTELRPPDLRPLLVLVRNGVALEPLRLTRGGLDGWMALVAVRSLPTDLSELQAVRGEACSQLCAWVEETFWELQACLPVLQTT